MKKALKEEIFGKRKALSKEDVEEKSEKIKESLYSLPEFKKAKNILFYVSFNNEASTVDMIKELLDNGEKNIIVPFVEKNNPMLQLSELKNFNDLEPKTFEILEPKKNKIKKIEADKIDLIIVPGIVFDKNGHRIGYGYGYYDRLLEELNNAVKIGLCYGFQLVDKVPKEQHDIPVDIIVTEKRILKTGQ